VSSVKLWVLPGERSKLKTEKLSSYTVSDINQFVLRFRLRGNRYRSVHFSL